MSDVLTVLKDIGAIVTDDHFVYTSGKHGSVYIRKDLLYPHTEATKAVCQIFAEKYIDKNIEVVVGPSIGGIILSQWVANHLTQKTGKEVLGVFTEKDEESNQVFKRGYDQLVNGKNVLIVEDLITTGGSVKKVVDSVKAAGGNIVEVSVMVNRDPEKVTAETIGAPLSFLGVFKAEAYEAETCPLCKENIPVNTTVGHGQKFLSQQV